MVTGSSKEIVNILKGLLEICREGEAGYHTAAKNIHEPEYKSLLENYSLQRARFAGELESEIRKLGGDEDDKTARRVILDAAGAVHRSWMNLRSAINHGKADVILNECETGEDAALKAYRNVLTENRFTAEIATIVRVQYQAIQEAHDRVKALARVEEE
jgi:uncharacterized protein (TIGR02284 family)